MGGEEGHGHRIGAALAGGEADEAVGIDGGGGAADALEMEGDALCAADLGDGGVETAGALLAAELAHDVVAAGHAEAGHVGVQQEGVPGQRGGDVRPAVERAQQALDAEIAPGADEVVDDLDHQLGLGGHVDVHAGRVMSGRLASCGQYRGAGASDASGVRLPMMPVSG